MSDTYLKVTCWCERHIVRVPKSALLAGLTGSCGARCFRGCAPFERDGGSGRTCVQCGRALPAYLGAGARFCPGTACKEDAATARAAAS